MTKRPFTAKLPKTPENGDEVLIRGKLLDDARSFSVNFCLPRPPHLTEHDAPSYILYHFKTIYDDANNASTVVQNWKNLHWQQEEVFDNHWHVDRSKTFRVIFRLHEDCIKMFVNSVDHPPDYEFSVQLPLDQVESIELWDDVENVEEISFRVLTTNDWWTSTLTFTRDKHLLFDRDLKLRSSIIAIRILLPSLMLSFL